VHEGRPEISGDGRIVMWCAVCWPVRHEPMAAPVRVEPAPSSSVVRSRWRRRGIAAGISVVVLGLLVANAGWQAPLAGIWSGSFDFQVAPPSPSPEIAVALASLVPERDVFDPDRGADDVRDSDSRAISGLDVPLKDGEPLDSWYPTLHDWVHPVAASRERVPSRSGRWFGAPRVGVEREECGAGHCGVDLGGPRGQPILAVAWGVVVRVEHSWMGRDGRSGRYVRLEHPDGVYTSYMHLDDIATGLEVGDEVEAGQMVGTLGKSGIVHGMHHLHFSLEVPGEPRPLYIDPAPFLRRARVLETADRRPPRSPQW